MQYVDTGTYIVSLLDSLGCSFARDTVVVTGYSSSILAFAGIDTFVCRSDGIFSLMALCNKQQEGFGQVAVLLLRHQQH